VGEDFGQEESEGSVSATNRSNGTRKKDDTYNTPDELALACTRALADLPMAEPRTILEPSVGGGAFARAAATIWPRATLETVDIAKRSDATYTMPFEKFADYGWDLILGNPPYSLAEPHIRHALALLTPGGVLAFLLRTAFKESKKRLQFWREFPHRIEHQIVPRPSFTGKGSDATSYSWFVWQRGYRERPVCSWLEWTPPKKGRAAK
jgi:hypothetical protein